jgi:GNAT superfamily N-acetyltransferase
MRQLSSSKDIKELLRSTEEIDKKRMLSPDEVGEKTGERMLSPSQVGKKRMLSPNEVGKRMLSPAEVGVMPKKLHKVKGEKPKEEKGILENAQEIYDKAKETNAFVDFSQGTEKDLSRPISTITGKPTPTAEERFAGSKAIMNLIPYGFASFTRGLVPKAAEEAAMQPIIKALTGQDYVSPITEALKTSGKYLPENVQKAAGIPAQMAGIVAPLSVSFKTASSIIKTLGVSEEFLVKGSPILSTMAYNIFKGGIAGAIYEGMESGEPEEMIKTGAFFAALDGVFGAAAGTIKKVSESTWYRKLEIKERGLVVQTAADMRKAGHSEGTILRSLSNKTEREALLKEAMAKRAKREKPITPTPKVAPEPGRTVNLDKIRYKEGGDAIGQEYHGHITAYDTKNKKIGTVDYSYFNGKTAVKMIEVEPGYQRQGVATRLLEKLQEGSKTPIEIQGTFATKEGQALFEKIKPAKPQSELIPTKAKPEAVTKEFKGEGIGEPTPKTMTADEIAAERKQIESEMADISLKEYDRVSKLASMRALENLQKSEAKEDRAIDTAARKFAKEMVEASPVYTMIDDLKKRGGINYRSLETMGINGYEIAELIKRHPGLVSKEGKIYADKMVDDLGYDSISGFVEEVQYIDPKTEAIEKYFNQSILETDQAASDIRLEYLYEKILDEEIKVLNSMLGKKPKTRKDLKGVIREKSGIIKINEVLEVKERDALKNQLMFEARAARKAFSEGRREAALKHKEKQRAAVIKVRANKIARKRTTKIINGLKKINTEKMSTPQAQAINNILSDLDLTKLPGKKRLRLSKTKAYLDGNTDSDIPIYVLEDLKRLDKTVARDLTLDELESINMAVLNHVHLEKTKQTIRVGRENRRKEQVLKDSLAEMKPAKKVKDDVVSSQTSKIGKLKRTGRLIVDTFGIRHDHYDLIVESLAGPNSTMDKVLYRSVDDGTDIELKHRRETFKKFQDDIGDLNKLKIKDMTKWGNETVTIGKFKLTRAERMALYNHSLNTDNKRAIIKGGFGFKFSETPNAVHKMTEAEMGEILNSLTEAELKIAGDPVRNLYNADSLAINKVLRKKQGFEMQQVEPYYHKETMPLARGKDIETEIAEEQFKGRIGLQKGRLEKRKGVTLPIYLNSLFHDINQSVAFSSAYVGLEIPLSNASKLLYNPTFRLNLTNRYGEQTWKEIEKGLKDVAGEHQAYTTTEKLLLKAKNRLSVAMLGLNPFVMAKQVLSLPVYLPYVKSRYLAMGIIDNIWHPKQIMERHKTYSPKYLERVEGGYSRDVADVFKAGAEKRVYGGEKSIREKFMGGIKLFDKGAVIPGMQGAVLQVLDEFKSGKLSRETKRALDIKDSDIANFAPEDKMRLAYKYADWATTQSQPMFSPAHRSSLSRGSTIEQLATMFGSFTNQALNLTRRSYRDAVRTGDKEAYIKLSKSLMTIFVINTLGVMAIDEIRNRIYGRKGGSIAGRVLSSWAGYMFFVRDLASSVISKVERGTFLGYDVNLPISRIPELLSNSIANGVTTLTEKDTKKRKKAVVNFIDDSLELSLMLYGIPYATPKKMGQRIVLGAPKKAKKQKTLKGIGSLKKLKGF